VDSYVSIGGGMQPADGWPRRPDTLAVEQVQRRGRKVRARRTERHIDLGHGTVVPIYEGWLGLPASAA